MDDQSDVRLVYTHTEGVGGDDCPQVAVDEVLLDRLLGLMRKSCVEVFRRHSLGLEELCQVLGLAPRRAVNDRSAGLVFGQVSYKDLVDIGELLAFCGPYHH